MAGFDTLACSKLKKNDMKIYNTKVNNGKQWYVHITKWKYYPDALFLFRGDSDPAVMYRGTLRTEEEIFDEVYYEYDAYKLGLSPHEKPMDMEDFAYNAMDYILKDLSYAKDKSVSNTRKVVHTIDKTKMEQNKITPRNEEEQKIMRLSASLANRNDCVDERKYFCRDLEWDAHQSQCYTLSEYIDDYQVLRHFCVDSEPCDPLDRMNDEERVEYEDEMERTGMFDVVFQSICERLQEETGDCFAEYEYAEVAQTWINVKTGNTILLGKIYKDDPRFFDFEGEYEIVGNSEFDIAQGRRIDEFLKTFDCFVGDCKNYDDFSVHPRLTERGYKPLSAGGYESTMSVSEQDDDIIIFNSITEHETITQILSDIAKGGTWERRMKMYSDKVLFILRSKIDEQWSDAFDVAVKIMQRNNYKVEDLTMYADMFNAMCELGKDIHNPFYVCPTDFKDMHDKMMRAVQRKRDKEVREINLAKARAYSDYYDSLLEKFGAIHIHNDKYQVFMCPSLVAMSDEGEEMHHCVFKMGYYKPQYNCLILLCRDANDIKKRISTIELSLKDFSIVQNRGACNSVPEGLDEINELIKSNIKLFKKANRRKQEKTIVTMPMAA